MDCVSDENKFVSYHAGKQGELSLIRSRRDGRGHWEERFAMTDCIGNTSHEPAHYQNPLRKSCVRSRLHTVLGSSVPYGIVTGDSIHLEVFVC